MTDKAPETLLDELLQLETETERETYLDRVCQDDDELRQRLEGMLLQHRQAGQFFQDAGLDPETELSEEEDVSLDEAVTQVEVGAVIDRYKILEKIGEGGMGDVYMAEQVEPVSRMVALKIIKLGMDTKQVVARWMMPLRSECIWVGRAILWGLNFRSRARWMGLGEWLSRFRLSSISGLCFRCRWGRRRRFIGCIGESSRHGWGERPREPSLLRGTARGDALPTLGRLHRERGAM